ncbi:glutaredoxin family protein [Nigerium massiliense]|uniref:glutaredoxin family protein n=1 Tax=Nigerium massiliense TaxID=1522317 RepID=UPI00058D271C|nr:glutaredoxin family protein [Nigerium massiliense]
MLDLDAADVVVLVRDGCHLCDDAVHIIDRVCQDVHASWQAFDVDEDADVRAQYTDHVPVTFVRGAQHALWFVDETALRTALVG